LRPGRVTLATRLSRAPTVSELAREAGVDEGEVAEAVATERARATVSLSTQDGEPRELGDAVLVEDAFDSSDDRMLLSAGFRTLDARQRRVVHLRYFAGLSQAEIARELGLSEMQVSRALRAALERLRGALAGANGRDRPTRTVRA
jgi:RNA polymerase sigma-B factor